MAGGAVELLGLSLSLCGWGAVVAATALWQWQTSTYAGDSIVTAVSMYQGLWGSCVSTSTGQLQCKAYDSLLALPASTQATRALMLLGAILGPLALAAALSGLQCTQCGGDDPGLMGWLGGAGGALFLLAGLAALIACSWYAHRVISDFYSPAIPVNLKYELGPALFVGWGGSALLLLGGAALLCSCGRGAGSGKGRYPRVNAAPRKTGAGSATDYV